jgi:hypothetical protein
MKAHIAVLAIAVSTLAFATSAMAVSATGTLVVTGTLAGAISVTFGEATGGVSGFGSNALICDLGTVTRDGTVPDLFTRTSTSTDWTLSGWVFITVDKVNLTSANYTMTARLSTLPPTGVTWKMSPGSVFTLSSTAATTLSSTASYGSSIDWVPSITFTNAAAPGSIGNTINFVATSN